MSFASVFLTMAKLFLLLIVGFAAQKLRAVPEESQAVLTKLIVNVTMPAMILSSVLANDDLPGLGTILELLGVSLAFYAVSILLAFALVRVLRVRVEERGVYACMLIFTNTGFIGYPVVRAIFGETAVFYTAVYTIPFNAILFTLGVWLLCRDAACQGISANHRFSGKDLVSPALVACLLAVVIALTGFKTPEFLTECVGMLGDITTPGSLLVIGFMIAKQPLKQMLGSVRIYLMTALRLVILPVLIFLLFRMVIHDELILGITIVMAGMPCATAIPMFCGEYGGTETTAVQGVFITTLLSMVTIPLLITVLM